MLRFKHSLKATRSLYSASSLTSTPTRYFALFQSKTPSQQSGTSRNYQEDVSKPKDYHELGRSIDKTKRSIAEKTRTGRNLAYQIAEEVEPDKYIKLQRYEIFINKMERLYKHEMRYKKKQDQKFFAMQQAHVFSQQPLKDILRYYNDLSVKGFESSSIVGSLQQVSKALSGRGHKARVANDYSVVEMDQSWRMEKLIDDIKFGLRRDQYFNPLHLAQTSELLGEIGYKNTTLIPLFFDKLKAMVSEMYQGRREHQEVTLEDQIYGGGKNQPARHHVFQGFQDSAEFQQYLTTLMEWEGTSRAEQPIEELQGEAAEIQESLQQVIDAAVQVKELQKDYQSSIDSLRQQYFKMQEATDKYEFLVDNPYIKYDLLELQEMLVNAGYVDINEQAASILQEDVGRRMERAANVFYDYVLNYQNELLSPQHEVFYQSATANQPKKEQVPMHESQTFLSLRTLSQTLSGLAQQALSYRRDTEEKDYLHKFYEEYLYPLEQRNFIHEAQKLRNDHVMMEREYLKAWETFREQSAQFIPVIEQLIADSKDDIEGQLYALNGLVSIRYDAPHLRKQLVENLYNALDQAEQHSIQQEAIVEGLKGLAQSASTLDNTNDLVKQLISKLQTDQLSFIQQLDALWSLGLLGQINSAPAREIVQKFNQLNFERIEHDITYDQYLKLLDTHNALKYEGDSSNKFDNFRLQLALDGGEQAINIKYEEHGTHYDPFKKRVLNGLAKGLTDASISHQVIHENELFDQQYTDINSLNKDHYPYTPDVILGYKGQKVGLFILPETQTFIDTYSADGRIQFQQRMINKASQNEIQGAAIAIPQVVDYDIAKLRLNLKTDFNLQKQLDKQISGTHTQEFDFSTLADFGQKLIQKAPLFSETLQSQQDVNKFDSFINQLYKIFQLKQQTSLRFDPRQKNVGYDDLKVQLMKLSLIFDTFTPQLKGFVNQFLPDSRNFSSILHQAKDSIQQIQVEDFNDTRISPSWIGTRLEVELPVSQPELYKKSLVPELINQKFMWVDDYFHYADWKAKQQDVFDNFNLLVIPRHKDTQKLFFDRSSNHRIVPQGIFPFPNHKRQVMLPAVNQFAKQLIDNKGHDQFTLFEKEPHKMMVINELKKQEHMAPIDPYVSMITNLQNIKQGLKSDYTDKEILNIILLNLSVTDLLIEEHLGLKQANVNKNVKFLPRDSTQFREFVKNTYFSKDIEDAFSHFYLKEAAKQERVKRLYDEDKELQKEEDVIRDRELLEKTQKQRKEVFQDKIERMLLQNELENEDLISLSHTFDNHIKVNYDLKTLIKTEYIYDIEPELQDETISAESYLAIKRRYAETKLIKSRIVYKLYQGHSINSLEQKYLEQWVKDLSSNKDRNLLNVRESMVPKYHSKATIGDLDAKNLYTLNSIPRVQVERDKHRDFAINDLVLELSHFLDEEVINRVELDLFLNRLKKDWNLSDGFRLVESRNKEIGLVINELEEVAWRTAGQVNDDEFDTIKKMVSIQRNMELFDREYYENDIQSMKDYVNAVNSYDNRISLIEQWVVRKEDEYKSRVNRPPAHLKKTDKEIYAQLDRPIKKAREALVAKLLEEDEHGNKISKVYKDLTSRELNRVVESLCVRLYLFNYDYPQFLFQAVKGVMDHPNLSKSDKDMLDTYCKVFEVDWRGIKDVQQRKDFLHSHPIHVEGSSLNEYGQLTDDKVKDMLKKACMPYIEQIAAQMQGYQK